MKKNLLFLMTAFFGFSFLANAVEITNVSGTYVGDMTVSVYGGDPTTESATQVVLERKENGTYTLTATNVKYNGTSIGSFAIDSLTVTENAGVVTLSKDTVTAMTVIYGGFPIPADITFTSGSVNGTHLVFQLDILATMEMMGTTYIPVVVNFDGNIPSGVNNLNADKISITQSADSNYINILGIENADYTIYNQKGLLVKNGVLDVAEINISDLTAGVYVVNINKTSAKFIKK